MGLIKAAMGAAGGTLADQWKEFFYCDAMDKEVIDNAIAVALKRMDEQGIKGKDSDYNNFEWIDIQDLKKLKTHPKELYTLIENDNIIKHIVEEINE